MEGSNSSNKEVAALMDVELALATKSSTMEPLAEKVILTLWLIKGFLAF